MFSLFGNPTDVWFESDPVKQVVRVHGEGLSANYHSSNFSYTVFGVTASGAVQAKISKIDIELDINMVTQECDGLRIPAINATDAILNVDTKFIELFFPHGNIWTQVGRQF